MREKYNPDKIFDNNKEKISNESKEIVEYKKSFFIRLIDKIVIFFRLK